VWVQALSGADMAKVTVDHRVRRWKLCLKGSKKGVTETFALFQDLVQFAEGHWISCVKEEEEEDGQCDSNAQWTFKACLQFSDRFRITPLKKILGGSNFATIDFELEPILTEKEFIEYFKTLQSNDTTATNCQQESPPIIYGFFLSESEQRKKSRNIVWEDMADSTTKKVLSLVAKMDEKGVMPAIDDVFCKEPASYYSIDTAERMHHKMTVARVQAELYRQAQQVVWQPWQQRLFNLLGEKPHPRQIIVVIDPVGNTGKTFFVQNYRRLYSNTTVHMSNTRDTDMLYSAQHCAERRVVLVDLVRSEARSICYSAIESLKNGSFVSSKYRSCMVDGAPPHLVMFTNVELDYGALSADRWYIFRLTRNKDGIISYTESDRANRVSKMVHYFEPEEEDVMDDE
jgi:hypothetical protein